eukprot:sb/3477564/
MCPTGKCLATKLRNFRPRSVSTYTENCGLNHITLSPRLYYIPLRSPCNHSAPKLLGSDIVPLRKHLDWMTIVLCDPLPCQGCSSAQLADGWMSYEHNLRFFHPFEMA